MNAVVERGLAEVTAREVADSRLYRDQDCGAVVSKSVKLLVIEIIGKARSCQRKATRAVLVHCSLHGIREVPVCDEHLAMLKNAKSSLHCITCDRPATWIGG